MCNIRTIIEYFAFLNWCNLTFSQIEIIIKFLRNFVKEGNDKRCGTNSEILHDIGLSLFPERLFGTEGSDEPKPYYGIL